MQIKLLEESPHKQAITQAFLFEQGFSPTIESRFWSKVIKSNSCWSWIGHRNKKGYGRLGTGGKGLPATGAHRISWILHYGPIPNGLCVLHHCDTPCCTRPDHLWLGTKSDNNRDQLEKGHHAITRKLSPEQVAEIKHLYNSGLHSQEALGAKFGIHQTGIGKMVRGETWKNPERPIFRVDRTTHRPTFVRPLKVTKELAEAMTKAYATGNYTYDEVRKLFGISIGYAYRIIQGQFVPRR